MATTIKWTDISLALLIATFGTACDRQEITATSVPTTPVKAPTAATALLPTQTAQHWLQLTCSLGDYPRLEENLRAATVTVEPIFIQAYREGPSTEVIREFMAGARARFAQRRAILESGEDTGLSPDDLAAARAVNEKTFLAQSQQDFENRYRNQAKLGLAIIGKSIR